MALGVPSIVGLVGVVGVCGFLPELADIDLSSGPPALLVAGETDEVVPAFLSVDAAATLRGAGREADALTLPGGHEVSEAAAHRVRGWLDNRFTPRQRISMAIPTERVETGTELVSGDAIVEIARRWECLGFDAGHVTDHPAPDDRWLGGGGHHALEPTVALAAAGVGTTRLMLHTHTYVLGYRNPFLAAKALASLDVVTGGRLILGVAAGYLRDEFDAVGAGFDDRGKRLDAALRLLGEIWQGDSVTAEGPDFDARSITSLPRPRQRPQPPIWVGGNSRRAMRRAAELGEGWSPFPTAGGLERVTRTASIADMGELAARIDEFRGVWAESGRGGRPTVCFSPFALSAYLQDPVGALEVLAEQAAEMYEIGVDWLALSVPGHTRAEVSERAEALADVLGLQPRMPQQLSS
jgi:probable F420-dependent oxidoreductase